MLEEVVAAGRAELVDDLLDQLRLSPREPRARRPAVSITTIPSTPATATIRPDRETTVQPRADVMIDVPLDHVAVAINVAVGFPGLTDVEPGPRSDQPKDAWTTVSRCVRSRTRGSTGWSR